MKKSEFFDYLKEDVVNNLNEDCGSEEYSGLVSEIVKNNGIVLHGLTIRKAEEVVSPNIYLDSYYDEYCLGKPARNISSEIIAIYHSIEKQNAKYKVDDIFDFAAAKDDIILQLVNFKKNEKMLQDCPHKRFLDLATTFRYFAGKDDSNGIATLLVSNDVYQKWDIDIEELYQIALSNTMRLFPWKIVSLLETMRRLQPEIFPLDDDIEDSGIYVLTNDLSINGATCILYNSVIKDFANEKGCNLFILPSSRHETMLVLEDEQKQDSEFLQNLIVEANQSVVGLIDFLSDNMYYYDRETDEFRIYGAEDSDE